MKTIISILALSLSSVVFAQDSSSEAEQIGVVDKVVGRVYVHENESPSGKRIDSPDYPLQIHDILRTKRNAQAFVTLIDKSRVILDQRSTLTFAGMDSYDLSQSNGKVIFHIYKKDRVQGVQIKTKNAIIGVKGTTFAVDMNDDGFNLYMKEGTVSVDSIKGEFEHYKQAELSEYQKFQQKFQSDFEKYKSDLNKEFKEYVKSLSVSGGDSISVVDNKVVHVETPEDVKELFRMIDSY